MSPMTSVPLTPSSNSEHQEPFILFSVLSTFFDTFLRLIKPIRVCFSLLWWHDDFGFLSFSCLIYFTYFLFTLYFFSRLPGHISESFNANSRVSLCLKDHHLPMTPFLFFETHFFLLLPRFPVKNTETRKTITTFRPRLRSCWRLYRLPPAALLFGVRKHTEGWEEWR